MIARVRYGGIGWRFYRPLRYYRYDERSNGLSDHEVENLSPVFWLPDLEAVVDAANPEKPFVLLGISQGAASAISYAIHHPESVSHLIIYGGYTKGWAHREAKERHRRQAVAELTGLGWGKPDPLFRCLYTSMFLPGGSDEQLRWFDDLCARTTSAKTAARIMRAQGDSDFSDLAEQVEVPTLVLHAREDAVVPFSQGIELRQPFPTVNLSSPIHPAIF